MLKFSGTVLLMKSCLILTVALQQFIPPVCGNATLTDWDLAVAHGSNIMLISHDTKSSLDVPIQMPAESLTTSPEANIETTQNQKSSQHLVSLAGDPKRQLIFLSQISKSMTSVAVFNLLENTTRVLFQKANAAIDGLAYYNKFLYWSDHINVMRLNTTVLEGETAEVIVTLNGSSINGIAVNPVNGDVYWADWSRSSDLSTINVYDSSTSSTKVLVSQLDRPHGITADATHLYWVNNPAGVSFTIERVLLSDPSQRNIVWSGQYKQPFAMTTMCSQKLIWSDVITRKVYEIDIKSRKSTAIKEFSLRPFGIVSNGEIKCESLQTEKPIQNILVELSTSMNLPAKDTIVLAMESGQNNDSNESIQSVQNDDSMKSVQKDDSKKSEVKDDSIDSIKSVEKADTMEPMKSVQKKNSTESMEWCNQWETIPCLNGASCLSVGRKIFCLCTPGFMGPTCDEKRSDRNQEILSPTTVHIIGIIFLVLIVILIMIIAYLALKVKKLNKKPKIHKKIVVAKTRGRETSVCEMIDIENCCNMNICETPCYERPRESVTTIASKKSKAYQDEDKQRLINE